MKKIGISDRKKIQERSGKSPSDCIQQANPSRRVAMKKGEKLVIVGCGGVGGPAAILSKKLMPEVEVTVIREEKDFIVR